MIAQDTLPLLKQINVDLAMSSAKLYQHSTVILIENPSFIIFSAETEYTATRSWYRNKFLDLQLMYLHYICS
jgi:hypothetical protein